MIYIISAKQKMWEYLMGDTVAKENFTDIEICSEEDNYLANQILEEILLGYSEQDCENFLAAMERDCPICIGGWQENVMERDV